jgi:hypothetical protein
MPVMRLLTLLAVLLAPIGMVDWVAAQALPAMEHCAGMQQVNGESGGKSEGQPAQRHDCMMACAAIPSLGLNVVAEPRAAIAATPVPPPIFVHGLSPEAATPPPRSA